MQHLILLTCVLGASAIVVKEMALAEKPKKEKKDEVVGGRSKEERAKLPKFFLLGKDGLNFAKFDKDGFSWAAYRWSLDNPGLKNHPAKTTNINQAKFVITCCLDKDTKRDFAALPKRSPQNPYLIKVLSGPKEVQSLFEKRDDFIAINYDLRDSMRNDAAPLRGITIAPHNYFNGKKQNMTANRNFFVTFQGRKTSKLRHQLHDAFNLNARYSRNKNISVETIMDRMWNVNQQTGDKKFNMKMNSTYVLLPKGDDRWSLRFSETLGAGAIPVILADGLTMPYEDIIDWSKAAIRLPNNFANNADDIMKKLPTDEKTIMKMREAVYDIQKTYFASPETRADAMLMEAEAFIQKGAKYDPIWKPELAEPWMEQNREGATEESKKIAEPLAKAFKTTPVPVFLKDGAKPVVAAAKPAAKVELAKTFVHK